MAVDRTDIETGRLLSAVVTWPEAQLTEHVSAGSVARAAPKSSIRSPRAQGPGTPPQTAPPVAGFSFGMRAVFRQVPETRIVSMN
jgi:hypothetical protein